MRWGVNNDVKTVSHPWAAKRPIDHCSKKFCRNLVDINASSGKSGSVLSWPEEGCPLKPSLECHIKCQDTPGNAQACSYIRKGTNHFEWFKDKRKTQQDMEQKVSRRDPFKCLLSQLDSNEWMALANNNFIHLLENVYDLICCLSFWTLHFRSLLALWNIAHGVMGSCFYSFRVWFYNLESGMTCAQFAAFISIENMALLLIIQVRLPPTGRVHPIPNPPVFSVITAGWRSTPHSNWKNTEKVTQALIPKVTCSIICLGLKN